MSSESSETGVRCLHVFTLSSLAIAHPVLDLLARDAGFFVVRRSSTVEIALLVFTLLVVVPLPLVALTALSRRFATSLGDWVHHVIIGGLAMLMAGQALTRLALLDGEFWLVAGILLGSLFAWAYHRLAGLRVFTTYLSFVLIAIPALFFLDSRILKISFGKNAVDLLTTGAKTPVVFLVFDEFSLTSLLDEHHQIDPLSYPNLAAFAEQATWFPNATTVSNTTVLAVPAILTGHLPESDQLPMLDDHPRNLFTALGGDYKIWAVEPITQLCPPTVNTFVDGRRLSTSSLGGLYSDLWIVYQHLLLPSRYSASLPVIADRWRDFGHGGGPSGEPARQEETVDRPTQDDFFKVALKALRRDRQEDLRRLINAFDPDEDQALYFLHVLLPHTPWEYLPSGKSYTVPRGEVPGLKKQRWDANEDFVVQAYQRYLMQVQFVDLWIGEIVQRLRELELYDRSLIVFAADHGVSFRPGEPKRAVSERNVADLLPVPLLIKKPHQRQGEVVGQPVSTIDILPSVLDVLDVKVPWRFDGRSVFGPKDGVSSRRVVEKNNTFEFEETLHDDKFATLEWKLDTFQGEGEPSTMKVLRANRHPDLFGQKVSEIGFREQDMVSMSLDGESLFRRHYTYSPAYIAGTLRTKISDRDCCEIAVAVNDTVYATVGVFGTPPNNIKFTALVPDEAFREGDNLVQFFRVRQVGSNKVLELLSSSQGTNFVLTESVEGATQIEQGELILPVKKKELNGYFSASVKKGKVTIRGWAADVKEKVVPRRILVFYRGELMYGGFNSIKRPEVNKKFDMPTAALVGFHFDIPLTRVPEVSDHGLRLFAISDHVASELGFFHRLEQGRDGQIEKIRITNGREIPVVSEALKGSVDELMVKGNELSLSGWAVDGTRGEPAERILVFMDDKLILSVTSFFPREDVAVRLEMPEALMSGFKSRRRHPGLASSSAERVRVLAVSRHGRATLLPRLLTGQEEGR